MSYGDVMVPCSTCGKRVALTDAVREYCGYSCRACDEKATAAARRLYAQHYGEPWREPETAGAELDAAGGSDSCI